MLGCGSAEPVPNVLPSTAEKRASAPAVVAEPAKSAAQPLESVQRTAFGRFEGGEVELWTLTNQVGVVAKVSTFGAALTELHVPDRQGKLDDVVLGFESLDGYIDGVAFMGAIVGRVANRIRGAKFELDGKRYQLGANDAPHHLHGGKRGWDRLVWQAEVADSLEGPGVRLTHVSPDGEEGYPGTVTARVTYTLTHQNELKVEMDATTDRPTLVNMAQHSYWNLSGHGSGSIVDHELQLFADAYTPGDPLVPTGLVKPVQGTPFDFGVAKRVGKDLVAAGGQPVGYDHNFVIRGEPNTLRPVARLKERTTGRVLSLEADQPGLQFYSGNFLNGKSRGKGALYAQYTGLCLETQKFPNAINVPAWKDQMLLAPGDNYRHRMVYRFSVD